MQIGVTYKICISVDKVRKALVFLGLGLSLYRFWRCSHVWRNSWRCYYTFLGFR
jgi:hypothetical protein